MSIWFYYRFYRRCYCSYDKHSSQYNHCSVGKIMDVKIKRQISKHNESKCLKENNWLNRKYKFRIITVRKTCKNVFLIWYSTLLLNTIFTDARLTFPIEFISRTSLRISYSSSVLESSRKINKEWFDLYSIMIIYDITFEFNTFAIFFKNCPFFFLSNNFKYHLTHLSK